MHEPLPISLSAAPEDGRWNVSYKGQVIGQIQETWEGTTARIVGSEGYAFPGRWTAASAIAYGYEEAEREMRMIGY